jgi:hypothetical protein
MLDYDPGFLSSKRKQSPVDLRDARTDKKPKIEQAAGPVIPVLVRPSQLEGQLC